jgi:hypothetical protein
VELSLEKAVGRWRLGFEHGSGHVGFVVDKEALVKFFPSISISPTNVHSASCSAIAIIYHLGLVQYASSGRSTKWTQSHPTKNNRNKIKNNISGEQLEL